MVVSPVLCIVYMVSLLLETFANLTPVLAQAADAAQAAGNAAQDLPFFAHKALIYAAAFTSIGFAAIGSAYGCGSASCAAMGAWKKCYAQNKPAPFQLLIFAGAPLSQTIYGMIVMFIVMGGASDQLMALGIVETVAIFVLAFSIVLLNSF